MSNEDRLINAVLEIKDDVKELKQNVAYKTDLEPIVVALDKQGQILERLDQERLFTLERIKRIEADVEQMKLVLKIA